MVLQRLFSLSPRRNAENHASATKVTATPATPAQRQNRAALTPLSTNTPRATPLTTSKKPAGSSVKKLFQNGYVKSVKLPSYTPFSLKQRHKRLKEYEFEVPDPLHSREALPIEEWNTLAVDEAILKDGQSLLEFQVDSANHIIKRDGDLCVIAPTGAGKSLVWVLPLLAQGRGVSLVVVPYTSLGAQGELRHWGTSIQCTFLHSKSNSDATLAALAGTRGPHVVYVCPEMLETPAVARVLHAKSFRAVLSGIYLDEAHSVHENMSWRPSYMNLHLLRRVGEYSLEKRKG